MLDSETKKTSRLSPSFHDGWDVAWGVLNSLASNFVGTQRVENGNSDVKTGQALGDAVSVTVGGAVAITTVVGGVAADAYSGGAALVLSPAEAVVASTAVNGALQGGKNLLKSAIEDKSSGSKPTRDGGSRTEPTLPDKTVANENGVEINHNYRSGDHGPAHLHVEGGGDSTKIGMNGKPIKGSPELSSTQQKVVDNNKSTIRRAVDKIGRWLQFKEQ